jgi:organic hydroperoxide reductase OsmC/OhrA
MTTAMKHAGDYAASVIWTGNLGEGTASYTAYGRDFTVVVPGKPELYGSADAAYRGSSDRHNPEELFLASLAACQMLFYLSLCGQHGIRVLSYESRAAGGLTPLENGGGRFEGIALTPVVTVAGGTDTELAIRLHDRAHERCFIANSCSVPIRRRLVVRTEVPESGSASMPAPVSDVASTATGHGPERAGES